MGRNAPWAKRWARSATPPSAHRTRKPVALEGRSPTGRDAAAITDLGPRAVSRTVVSRLRGLPEEATEIARAVAILGDGSDLATVVYSRPETTVVFLLIPMALIVALAFAGRRTER